MPGGLARLFSENAGLMFSVMRREGGSETASTRHTESNHRLRCCNRRAARCLVALICVNYPESASAWGKETVQAQKTLPDSEDSL